MAITKAVTHIWLGNANQGKLAALDAVAEAYMALCQTYVTHFCTVAHPDAYGETIYPSPLSARWQRVAVMQAAGVAQSWRTKRRQACQEYGSYQAYYEAQSSERQAKLKRPVWREWRLPELKSVCIQANVNVVKATLDTPDTAVRLERPTQAETFDLWLQIATLEKRRPLYLPVQLAAYHRQLLSDQKVNSSVTLHRRKGSWWLTLSFNETVAPQPVQGKTGMDLGMANWLTSSDGKRYGSFDTPLVARHEREQHKRQNKTKLRACLEKQGVTRLPSTSSASGERLSRHICQEINRAVNLFFEDHPHDAVVMEALAVRSLRFKARFMNARLKASQLGHIPRQVHWGAAKRGLPIVLVNPAYSSQECSTCHFVARGNRPNQQTFCCQVCGFRAHADHNASLNLLQRADDKQLAACTSLQAIKDLLLSRHAAWKAHHGYP